MFSFVGDVILDPFAGSGSTTVAAIRTGRNSISVEIEEEYSNAATRRVASEAACVRRGAPEAVVVASVT
jgi:DNA modification methylase